MFDSHFVSARVRRLGPLAWLSIAWLTAVAAAATFVGVLPIRAANAPDYAAAIASRGKSWTTTFGATHPLGVDASGNDLLSYALHGARTSLLVGLISVGIGSVLGGSLGVSSGYRSGTIDVVATFAAHVLLVIPTVLLLMLFFAVMSADGDGITLARFIVTIGVLESPVFFRIARNTTRELATRPYVSAARALGATPFHVLRREITPAVAGQVIAFSTTAIGAVIVLEGTLSYLGVGVGGATISWGKMIQAGADSVSLATTPHALFVPGGFVFLTVLSCSFLGEAMAASLDNRLRPLP